MKFFERWVMIFIVCILIAISVFQNEQIIALQLTAECNTKCIETLKGRKCDLPIDHARIKSNVNLIGGKVFVNWKVASKLYAERGK